MGDPTAAFPARRPFLGLGAIAAMIMASGRIGRCPLCGRSNVEVYRPDYGPPYDLCVAASWADFRSLEEGWPTHYSCDQRLADGVVSDAPDILAGALRWILRPAVRHLELPRSFERDVACFLVQAGFVFEPPYPEYPAPPYDPSPLIYFGL